MPSISQWFSWGECESRNKSDTLGGTALHPRFFASILVRKPVPAAQFLSDTGSKWFGSCFRTGSKNVRTEPIRTAVLVHTLCFCHLYSTLANGTHDGSNSLRRLNECKPIQCIHMFFAKSCLKKESSALRRLPVCRYPLR